MLLGKVYPLLCATCWTSNKSAASLLVAKTGTMSGCVTLTTRSTKYFTIIPNHRESRCMIAIPSVVSLSIAGGCLSCKTDIICGMLSMDGHTIWVLSKTATKLLILLWRSLANSSTESRNEEKSWALGTSDPRGATSTLARPAGPSWLYRRQYLSPLNSTAALRSVGHCSRCITGRAIGCWEANAKAATPAPVSTEQRGMRPGIKDFSRPKERAR
mmetsp:Transcript_87188/g.154407  ORF Transcript_87188/g.154407 Transcript_87188/m.154407 type:complete len:215 (+) Transcript_87188:93-737(+)